MTVEPAVPPEVLARIRAPFLEGAAEPVDPPVLLPLSLLLDLTGEALRARLFVVAGEGGAELALRPDFTAPIARAHVESGRAEGRYVYEGRAFRVPPPGSDRPSEFLQLGLERLGAAAGPAADAETAGLAWRAARAGGRDDLSLLVGDLSVADALLAALETPPLAAGRIRRALSDPDALGRALDHRPSPQGPAGGLAGLIAGRPEGEGAAIVEEVWALAGVQPVGGRTALEIARRLGGKAALDEPLSEPSRHILRRAFALQGAPDAVLDQLAALAREHGLALDPALDAASGRLGALAAAGVDGPIVFAPGFGRPFSYYDGMLFEVRSAALGPDRPVAAGGRYDRLPPALGGPATPAVGCMVRPARAWSER